MACILTILNQSVRAISTKKEVAAEIIYKKTTARSSGFG